MHRTNLGDFELTIVSDGTYPLDGGAFFRRGAEGDVVAQSPRRRKELRARPV